MVCRLRIAAHACTATPSAPITAVVSTTAALAATSTTTVAAAAATTVALSGPVVAHALQHFCARVTCRCLHDVTAWGFACATPDGLATHGNGFGLFTGFGCKALNNFDFNVLLGETLDVLHEAFFIQAHQVHGRAIGTGAARAANAVHVVFADVRDFIVHHVRQVINVDATCSDVGGYQGTDVAAFEATQGLRTCSLALVAVQCHGLNAVLG